MILNVQEMWSDDQAITTTAASTNVIDLAAIRGVGTGVPVPIEVLVTVAFANGTSLQPILQTDNDEAFGSALALITGAAIATATLARGYRFVEFDFIPLAQAERYLRFNYVVVGTMNAGKITAGIVAGHQTGHGV